MKKKEHIDKFVEDGSSMEITDESTNRFVEDGSSMKIIEEPEEETINFPQCIVCEHLIDAEVPSCEAYPDGIPDALFFGEISHEQTFKGDNGVLFEAIEDILVKES